MGIRLAGTEVGVGCLFRKRDEICSGHSHRIKKVLFVEVSFKKNQNCRG